MAAEQKTRSAPLDRAAWLLGVEPARRVEAERLLELIADVTSWEPRLWWPSMVGFGRYEYRHDSGHGGESLVKGAAHWRGPGRCGRDRSGLHRAR